MKYEIKYVIQNEIDGVWDKAIKYLQASKHSGSDQGEPHI